MSTLDDAVRRAAEELSPGQHVIGWVLVYAALPEDAAEDQHDLTVLPADGQPAYSTAGLLTLGREQVGRAS